MLLYSCFFSNYCVKKRVFWLQVHQMACYSNCCNYCTPKLEVWEPGVEVIVLRPPQKQQFVFSYVPCHCSDQGLLFYSSFYYGPLSGPLWCLDPGLSNATLRRHLSQESGLVSQQTTEPGQG